MILIDNRLQTDYAHRLDRIYWTVFSRGRPYYTFHIGNRLVRRRPDRSFSLRFPLSMLVSVSLSLPRFVLNIFSVAHTLVMVYQTISLNVAVNSYDHALLTLLMSNQFVEIKGSVFKKFEKDNLFQITCAGMQNEYVSDGAPKGTNQAHRHR